MVPFRTNALYALAAFAAEDAWFSFHDNYSGRHAYILSAAIGLTFLTSQYLPGAVRGTWERFRQSR